MSDTDIHPLLTIFDRIYVINLAHRADRRREMQVELRRIGLSLDHPAVRLFPASFPDDAGGFPSKGARGCFDSHLRVHQDILESGVARALVLEDDVGFAGDFRSALERIAAPLTAGDWQMLYSVCAVAPGPGDQDLGAGLLRLSPENRFGTTHFLGFTREFSQVAAPYLTAMMQRPGGDARGGPMHVDGAYGWLRRDHPGISVWATRQPLGIQRPSRSDIADQPLYDRIPGLRRLAQWARRLRG